MPVILKVVVYPKSTHHALIDCWRCDGPMIPGEYVTFCQAEDDEAASMQHYDCRNREKFPDVEEAR